LSKIMKAKKAKCVLKGGGTNVDFGCASQVKTKRREYFDNLLERIQQSQNYLEGFAAERRAVDKVWEKKCLRWREQKEE